MKTGVAAFLLLLFVLPAPGAAAQSASGGDGVLRVTDWPASVWRQADEPAVARERFTEYDVLPFLDTLAVEYRYAVDGDLPAFSFLVDWTPGAAGLLRGEEVPYSRLPQDVRLLDLALRADVVVDGAVVAASLIRLDSLVIGPAPDYVRLDGAATSWADVFVDTPADSARAFFARGFTLQNPEIVRIAFGAWDEPAAARVEERVYDRPAYPPRVTVYEPPVFVDIHLGWWFRPKHVRRPASSDPPRGDRLGRSADRSEPSGRTRRADREAVSGDEADEERSGRRGKKKSSKDEEEEDDDLLPAAGAALVAVGTVAVIGGTVGYYGTEKTPIGVAAGYVGRRGGILLQGSVNMAVLEKSRERESLVVKVTGFADLFRAPVQPALGFGVLAEAVGDDTEVTPAFSLGLAGNFGPVVLLGAYDALVGGFEFGLHFNFRAPMPGR